MNLFRHLHEIQTGRTSSISLDVLGFGAEGEPINHQEHNVEEILEKSAKLVTFIDLGEPGKTIIATLQSYETCLFGFQLVIKSI